MASKKQHSIKQAAKQGLRAKKELYRRLIAAFRKQIEALELVKEIVEGIPVAEWSQDKEFTELLTEMLHQNPLAKSAAAGGK